MTPETESTPATAPIPQAQLSRPSVANTTDCKSWTRGRLGAIKKTAAYKGLCRVDRETVDYLVRRYESPELGIFVSQNDPSLLRHFGIRRQAMHYRLERIVAAGAFLKARRFRANGSQTTNCYRLNVASWKIGESAAQTPLSVFGEHDPRTVTVLGAEAPTVRPTVRATVRPELTLYESKKSEHTTCEDLERSNERRDEKGKSYEDLALNSLGLLLQNLSAASGASENSCGADASPAAGEAEAVRKVVTSGSPAEAVAYEPDEDPAESFWKAKYEEMERREMKRRGGKLWT